MDSAFVALCSVLSVKKTKPLGSFGLQENQRKSKGIHFQRFADVRGRLDWRNEHSRSSGKAPIPSQNTGTKTSTTTQSFGGCPRWDGCTRRKTGIKEAEGSKLFHIIISTGIKVRYVRIQRTTHHGPDWWQAGDIAVQWWRGGRQARRRRYARQAWAAAWYAEESAFEKMSSKRDKKAGEIRTSGPCAVWIYLNGIGPWARASHASWAG